MKILSIYYTHRPGGFCKRLYSLLNGLIEAGHEVHFLSLDRPPHTASSKLVFHKVPFPLTQRRGFTFWFLLTVWLPFYTAYAALRIQPGKFVIFGAYYSAVIALAKYLIGRPSVLFVRSIVFNINRKSNIDFFTRWSSKIIYRFGLRSADKVIFQTATMKAKVEELARDAFIDAALLPNNAEEIPTSQEELELNIPKESLVVLAAGMLKGDQNIDYLIKAVATLKEPIFLLIAGEGPAMTELKSLCSKLDLTSVHFTGWLPSISPAIKAADLLVYPSRQEGVSNTILEALGTDLPVMASNIAEHQEILLHHELLFSLHDQGAELAGKLGKAVSDEKFYKSLKYLSKERAIEYKFDWVKRAIELATS